MELERWRCPYCHLEITGTLNVVLALAREHRCASEMRTTDIDSTGPYWYVTGTDACVSPQNGNGK